MNTTWNSDGYPVWFEDQRWGSGQGYQTVIGTYGAYPTGDYIITFNGTGNISLFGDATNVQYPSQNKITFTVLNTTTKGIIVTITKPNTTNIDLREAKHEGLPDTFSPDYLAAIEPFKAIRFTAWMTNRKGNTPNANVDWLTRRPKTYFTQVGQNMVSIEYILELANLLGKDIWLSMPAAASADYIKNMALYVKNNLKNVTTVYLEESANIGFNSNNRTATMQLISIWKKVFAKEKNISVKYILSTSNPGYFGNLLTVFRPEDLKQFDAFAVPAAIGSNLNFNFNGYNVSASVNFTESDINDYIQQEIYKDEIELIYLIQSVLYKMNKPLIGYDCGFKVNAPGFASRFFKGNYSREEQYLEDLIINSLRKPIVEDMYLDFMMRWYKLGGGILFLNNIVDTVDRCVGGGGYCGYKSIMENLLQTPDKVPKYMAARQWINGNNGSIPFTSANLPVVTLATCSPACVWGTCFNGTCHCYNGYIGSTCDTYKKKYLDCASSKTKYGVNVDGIADWSSELTHKNIQIRARKWIVQKIVFGNVWADWDQTDVQLRDDGYPKYLQRLKTVGTFLTRDVKAHFPNGKYVLLYDGDGKLN